MRSALKFRGFLGMWYRPQYLDGNLWQYQMISLILHRTMYGPEDLTINVLGIVLAWWGCTLFFTNTYPTVSNLFMVRCSFFNILKCFLLSLLFKCRISICSKEISCGKRKRSPFLEKERTTFLPSRGYTFHEYTMCKFLTETFKGDPLLIINSCGRQ